MMYTLTTLIKAVWILCSSVYLTACKSQSPNNLNYTAKIIAFHILHITFLNSVYSLVANRKSLQEFHRPECVWLDLYLKCFISCARLWFWLLRYLPTCITLNFQQVLKAEKKLPVLLTSQITHSQIHNLLYLKFTNNLTVYSKFC